MNIFDRPEFATDERLDRALRPQCFNDYIGQQELIAKLRVAIEAANQRSEPLDHILIIGPPGLGKTTISSIIASECGVTMRAAAAPSVKSFSDLLEILLRLNPRDVVFIDEIHALDHRVEENLYAAMEDFKITTKLPNKEIIEVPIAPFCLIGATTSPGRMAAPLRDRFGIIYTMQYYSDEELADIVMANAKKLELNVADENAILDIASRSRGTPRIANRLLRRVRDFAQINNESTVDKQTTEAALILEGVDRAGLTAADKKYLTALFKIYNCGPVGLHAIAATIGEDTTTVEDFIEPFLVRKQILSRTKSGRLLTAAGMKYVLENLK